MKCLPSRLDVDVDVVDVLAQDERLYASFSNNY